MPAAYPVDMGPILEKCWDSEPSRRPPISALLSFLWDHLLKLPDTPVLTRLSSQDRESFQAIVGTITPKARGGLVGCFSRSKAGIQMLEFPSPKIQIAQIAVLSVLY